MCFHRHACTIVKVLAGQVKVKLLELERLVAAGKGQVASVSDDLDRGSDILKRGPVREVGNMNRESRAWSLRVRARDKVNWRLVLALRALKVGGRV